MPFISARRISKSYGGVEALHDISLDIFAGEVHAVVGENGAGKSTLMKILAGEVSHDTGDLLLDGDKIEISDPLLARSLGIAIVHQQFELVEALTVAENMSLGDTPTVSSFGPLQVVDRQRMSEETAVRLQLFDLSDRANRRVGDLPVAERQIVEIAKALSRNAKLLILDEPTSSLNAAEANNLLEHIRTLRAQGTAIVYIAHSVEEVLTISDRVTVLRDGHLIATQPAAEFNTKTLISMIVGRELATGYPKVQTQPGETALQANSMVVAGCDYRWSLGVRRGEILGIPTYVGSLIDYFLGGLSGQYAVKSGKLIFQDRDIGRERIRTRVESGICFVPGDANAKGLIPKMSIEENIILPNLRNLQTWGFLHRDEARALAIKMIELLKIRPANPAFLVERLSGGNRQKVVIAKWLAAGARILIMDDPTKGVDVGAKVDIYAVMGNQAMQGTSMILTSSDVDELLGISDRIAVIRDGLLVNMYDCRPFEKTEIVESLTGTIKRFPRMNIAKQAEV